MLCVCVAPIRGLSLELSRLSGYEEMKCTVRHVFPAPQVTWATEPSTIEELRPVTRKLADKQGLYTVDSRLKTLDRQPDLLYICRVTSLYDGQVWTSSLRERGKRAAFHLVQMLMSILSPLPREVGVFHCLCPPLLNPNYTLGLQWQ